LSITGVGLHGLQAPQKTLDLGNSGTSIRLLCGLLAGQKFDSVLTGDASLLKRPMRRVTLPLAEMGADILTAEGGMPPLSISAVSSLNAIDYPMPVASAQVKSCLILAALYAKGVSRITESAPTRDHTERMLAGFGCSVGRDGDTVVVNPEGARLSACKVDVPADISSAAFFLVAASIVPGSDLLLKHVGINPTRIGVINILMQMGANIEITSEREIGGELVADIRVRYAQLNGIHIPEDQVPLAIDEFPVLFIAAACAEGETILTGAEELRVKESDRIQSMADGLLAIGVKAVAQDDGIIIQGGGDISGGEVDSHGDHRIAMAFTMAGLVSAGAITIRDCSNVNTSFPDFIGLARQVGVDVESA
jgi:3-phosphoshikimate 1-carboxyvinyltransferase